MSNGEIRDAGRGLERSGFFASLSPPEGEPGPCLPRPVRFELELQRCLLILVLLAWPSWERTWFSTWNDMASRSPSTTAQLRKWTTSSMAVARVSRYVFSSFLHFHSLLIPLLSLLHSTTPLPILKQPLQPREASSFLLLPLLLTNLIHLLLSKQIVGGHTIPEFISKLKLPRRVRLKPHLGHGLLSSLC